MSNPHTLGEAVRAAGARLPQSSSNQLDARVLIQWILGLDDAAMIAEDARSLTLDEIAQIESVIDRRAVGEPVSYITGVKEFWSLAFSVEPGVLIPRGDSETIVEAAIRARAGSTAYRILDLGTGSGCLLCALLSEYPKASGVGVDRSSGALAVASRNAAALGFRKRSQFVVSDWASALDEKFDIVVANPPYIPERARAGLPIDVRDFEPQSALFAGDDGLDAYRQILAQAPLFLAAKGLMVFEIGKGQAEYVAKLAAKAFPKGEIRVQNDLAGIPRAVLVDLA